MEASDIVWLEFKITNKVKRQEAGQTGRGGAGGERRSKSEGLSEKQRILHQLGEIIAQQISKLKYQRAHQEDGNLIHLWDSLLMRNRQEAIMGAIVSSISSVIFSPKFPLILSSHFIPLLPHLPWRSVYSVMVCGWGAAFPRGYLFFGKPENQMLPSWVLFSFSPLLRMVGETYTRRPSSKCFLSKAPQTPLFKLNTYELCRERETTPLQQEQTESEVRERKGDRERHTNTLTQRMHNTQG